MTDSYSDQVLEPDDIIIPDKEEEDKQHRFEELSTLGKIRLPRILRFLAGSSGLLLIICSAAVGITWAVLMVADTICLGKVGLFRMWRRWFWGCAKHTLGIGTGLCIATINPPLGFGMIILYIAYQEGEDLQKGTFFKSVRDYLRQYETQP